MHNHPPEAVQWTQAAKGLRGLGRFLLRTGLVVFVISALVGSLCVLLENWLIFFPARYPHGDWNPQGLAIEDAWFTSADGILLHGWYLPHPKPLAIILFCHGNAGNVTHRVEQMRAIHRWVGASVLVLDYRGYGRSSGRPTESGILADARAARVWLAHREQIEPSQIVLWGESIGAAVAVDVAATEGARALILEGAFTSLPDVAAFHYPFFPVRLFLRTRLDSLAKIGHYHGPLLQSHGNRDTIVPYTLGKRLFDAANEPKKFLTLHGADHNDLPDQSYYEAVRDFLRDLPPSSPTSHETPEGHAEQD